MSLYLGENKIADNTCSRNIGEIVASTIPLSDAGLHLLDGALISNVGSYAKFVNYIAGLVTDYPDLFVNETDWQNAVSTYGVCGKFVYDSVNNTVRLPKITGFVEGTTDVTALGDLVEAGLPNIHGYATLHAQGEANIFYEFGGALSGTGGSTSQYRTPSSLSTNSGASSKGGINLNASLASSIYGNSSTVQPQSIKVLYYIVIANSVKTNIEVDIDEIATDLNGKADVDLSNCTKPHIVETYVNGASGYRIWSDGYCEQWGYMTHSAKSQTISLTKTFKDTNYDVRLQAYYNAVPTGTHYFCLGAKSVNSFIKYSVAENGFTGCYWRACGYIS